MLAVGSFGPLGGSAGHPGPERTGRTELCSVGGDVLDTSGMFEVSSTSLEETVAPDNSKGCSHSTAYVDFVELYVPACV